MRRPLVTIAISLTLACATLVGCLYDWVLPATSDPADGGADASSETSGPTPPGTTSSSSGGPADSGFPGCGSTADCPKDSFCFFADHMCGKTRGICKRVPASCPTVYVCGCKAGFQKSECDVYAAGDDLTDDPSACTDGTTIEPGTFRCGDRFCSQANQYCVIHTIPNAMVYECRALCPTHDCSCSDIVSLAAPPTTCACNVSSGAVTLKCQQ